MTPPVNQRPSYLKSLWAAAGSTQWTGISRFAAHFQCLSLLLAAAQLWIGTYILASLLQYGKWTEACQRPHTNDLDYLEQALSPPFIVYTHHDKAAGKKAEWVGNFGSSDKKGFIVLYSLVLPICTLVMAGSMFYGHFSFFSVSLRMALYAGFWQMLDLLWYLYFNGSLIVDWYGSQKPANWERLQKPLEDWNVCFVDGARGAQIRKQGWTRIGCLEARAGIAITCGCVALIYVLLTLVGIHRAAKATRVAQQTYAANVRLQQLRTLSPVHGGSEHEYLEAAVSTSLPADTTVDERENDIGVVGNQRWADEVRGRSDMGIWEPVNPFEDPARRRDVV